MLRSWTQALVFMLAMGCQAKAETTDALKPARAVPLEGVEGRIDHLAYDAGNDRLYVAALGNNTVEVIDAKAGKRVARIEGPKKPQGVAVLPETGRVVVASGDDGKCRFYDDAQKLLGTVDGLDDADNVRYDPAAKLVYVGYGDGALAVIDPQKMAKVADIRLDGHPESFQLEANGNRIFVNVPTAKHVAVVDRAKRAVVAKWPVEVAGNNFPMSLDEADHRLFVACRSPAKLLVLDAGDGRVVQTLDCAGDADDVFYDAANRRVYVSGGEGVVSVIRQTDADHYRPLGRTTTAAGARTALFVPAKHTLYVAVPHRGGQAAELRPFKTSDADKQ